MRIDAFQKSSQSSTPYNLGERLIAKRDYLDLIKSGREYEITSVENNLGETMWYLSYNGVKISGWGFKQYELDIQFSRR